MKKFAIILVIGLFAGNISQAQVNKGTTVIGGHFFFNPLKVTSEYVDYAGKKSEDATNITLISLMPKVSYAIKQNVTIGGGLGYTNFNVKYEDSEQSADIFTIYPYARWYKTPLEHAGVFLETGLGIGFGKLKDKDNSDVYETSLFTINACLKPGFFIKLTNTVVFEATVGSLSYVYLSAKDKEEDDDKTSVGNFNFSLNPGLTFGFAFYIGKKNK